MPTSIVDADTLLAIDVGTVTTRAFFFDAVAGSYRFVAMGSAPSTHAPPLNDTSEGIRNAIDDLQNITGRQLLSAEEALISTTSKEEGGVDAIAATVSAVPPLKILAVGLLEDISLESARNLAATVYSRLVDSLSMNDQRRLPEKIDEILRHRPDLVIIAGGSENGASKSVIKLLDPVGLANYLMPEQQRPAVLFVGNSAVGEEVRQALTSLAQVYVAANIRPTLESEQLGPAEAELRSIFRRIHAERDPGVQRLDSWTSGRLLPGATGFGRMIRFISKNDAHKPVLGVDLGSSSTVVAAAHDGRLSQRIFSRFGIGHALESLMRATTIQNIARWLPYHAVESDVRDYILHKLAYPQSIPMTDEDGAMELALARELLRIAVRDAGRQFPADLPSIRPGLLPSFEPIILSGSVFANAAQSGSSLLAMLDALEPAGVTVFLLDTNNILPSLGAAAEANPILPIQVLETGVLKSLGTVISPVGDARTGTSILRLRAKLPTGDERKIDIKQGMLTTIPLEPGQKAELQLQPLLRYDVGLGGAGRGGTLKVVGGAHGIIIDARGRPLRLPGDAAQRRDLLKKWQAILSR